VIPPFAVRVTIEWSVCPPVCVSVTLGRPAKTVGWNEVPFGRDTYVVQRNIV